MAVVKKTELELVRSFDPTTCRHTLNGTVSVLHCHHYAALYAQLADDCSMLDAKKLMADAAEDTFYVVLSDYYEKHGLTELRDRLAIAEQYYSVFGLGKLTVTNAGRDAGVVELEQSHLDSGWLKKWGRHPRPVNFLTQGYIAATFAAAFGRAPRSYDVAETASIVSGAERSQFSVVAA